jgi:hypothetical protein
MNFKEICHPDRSVAKWRDLLFALPAEFPNLLGFFCKAHQRFRKVIHANQTMAHRLYRIHPM